ncbi:molybdate ABC transporter permease subunit [Paraglaciecola chathamensis]|uniref:molybdate ABC transporter permease subunit n=1 Tax=Paraglaciecola chathamensis TaxID=368405 RepID=UPI0027101A72|nr:molybdate ABC transporter permease subunit [Paraglaciecola chathamensis]MDO6557569.1 molybdate ABC transporter permease subunit [Paraglaciecola chathamensis]
MFSDILANEIWLATLLTLKLAITTTLILLIISIPLGWWLSQSNNRFKPVIEACVTLPLVLPPTVLGFYLLVLFSPQHPVGSVWVSVFDSTLVFSFYGLLFGSILYSLPFMVQPIRDAFVKIDRDLLDASRTLGANRIQTFKWLILPLSKHGITTGCILAFAHTIGEFGVVLLIGGNIESETMVLSILLYDLIETNQMEAANQVATVLVCFAFVVLLCLSVLRKRENTKVL